MDPNNPRGAIRSGSLLHIDEEIETAYQEAYKEQHPGDDGDMREQQQVATLDQHPGWKIVRKKFLERIESYRSGRVLAEYLSNYSLTDAQVGQATRNMNLLAGELTAILNEVTLAVGEVERHKQEKRDAARGQMGRRA